MASGHPIIGLTVLIHRHLPVLHAAGNHSQATIPAMPVGLGKGWGGLGSLASGEEVSREQSVLS